MAFGRPISIVAGTAALCLIASCTTISAPKLLAEDDSVKPSDNPDPTVADPYLSFNRALKVAQAASANQAARDNLLNEGFGLIDYRCGRYFAVLGKAEQNLSFDRKQTSLTSGVVLSLAGLAKATTRSVSTAGALFSFAGATMDSYEDAYLFSPDVKLVQDLVTDSMKTYHQAFNKELEANTDIPMSSVWATLAQYETLCQPASIKDLVNKSVASVQTKAASATDTGSGAPSSPNAASAPPVVAAASSAASTAASASAVAGSAALQAKVAREQSSAAAKAAKAAAATASAASSPEGVSKALAAAKAKQTKALAAARVASSTELAASQTAATAAQAQDVATTLAAAASAAQSVQPAATAPRLRQFVQPSILIEVVPKAPGTK